MSLPAHFVYGFLWPAAKYLLDRIGLLKKVPGVLDESLKIAKGGLEVKKLFLEQERRPEIVLRDKAVLVTPSQDAAILSTLSEIPKTPLEAEPPEPKRYLISFRPNDGLIAALENESHVWEQEYMRAQEIYLRAVEFEKELRFLEVERKHAPDLITFRQLRKFLSLEQFMVYTRKKEIEKALQEAINKRLQYAFKRLHETTKKLMSRKETRLLLLAIALWQAVPVLYGEQGPTLVAACLILFWLLFRPSTHGADSRDGRALCLT